MERQGCQTRDIDEAAYLKTIGFELTRVWVEPGVRRSTVFFGFLAPDGTVIDDVKRDFTNRKSLIEPKLFASNLRDIQDLLYDSLRRQNDLTRK